MAVTVYWRLAAVLVLYLPSVISQKPIGPEACQFAFMIDGSGRAAVDGDCTRYVHCDFSETTPTTAHIVDCPDGLFWNPSTLVCQFPEDVDCQFDPCVGNPNGTYQLPTDNCAEYWTCRGERTFQKLCCDFRESFSPGAGCVADVSCEVPCPREFVPQNLTGCAIVRHPTDDRSYVQLSEDGRSFDMRCALGGLYDPETCDCSIHDEDWVPFDPPNCVPSFSLSFPPENTFRDFSGYDSDIVNFRASFDAAMQDTPSGDRGAVFFDGVSNKIVSRRFNFAEFGYTPKFNITFREDLPDGRTGNVALLTNKACDMPSSVELYLMPESSTIRGQLLTEVGPISLEAPYQRSQWNTVLMAYNGEQLSLSINGIFRATPPTGNPAKVVPMQCSLQIGFGQAMNNFRGHIDEISITLC